MGSLRFVLAFSVIFAHTGALFGLSLVGSSVAVQSFFLISGFYMALILHEKYTGPKSYYLFITNRFLRLFPTYWAVLVLSVISLYILGRLSSADTPVTYAYSMFFRFLDVKSKVSVIFANIFIFGQDFFHILKIDPQSGFFLFTRDTFKVDPPFPPVFVFTFVPQAWSISTELLFYLIAPFLVRRRARVIVFLAAASITLRVLLFYSGYTKELWKFQFFPTELAFFLFGALTYKLYRRFRSYPLSRYGPYAFVFLIACTLVYQFVPKIMVQGADIRKWFYYIVLIACIPATFKFSGRLKIDKYLGELSYPLYISHYLILWVWMLFRERLLQAVPIEVSQIGIQVLILLLSIALFHLVINPIEKYRQMRAPKPLPLETPAAVENQ